MTADVANSLKTWSSSEGSNQPSGSTSISTNLDDNLRMIQKVVRDAFAAQSTVASASTTDIGAIDAGTITVSGTTTITSFGTVSAGIRKRLIFSGALTITHNATSMILPNGGADITTVAGDTCEAESLGSGNWRVVSFQRINSSAALSDGSAAAPTLSFSADNDTGLYRIGANSIGFTAGGTLRLTLSDAVFTLNAGGAVTIESATSTDTTIKPATGSSGTGGNVIIEGGPRSNTNQAGDVRLKAGAPASGTAWGDIEFFGHGGSASGRVIYRWQGYTGHFYGVTPTGIGNAPAIASGGGTSPTIDGCDTHFRVTLGTTPGSTAVVIDFGNTWDSAPCAIAQYQGSGVTVRITTTTTQATITPSASMTAGVVIDVICFGIAAA